MATSATKTASKGTGGGDEKKRVRWAGPSLSSAPQKTDDPIIFKVNVVSGTPVDDVEAFIKRAVKVAVDEHGATACKGTLSFTGKAAKK
jgi:hypothetical protein